MMGKLLNKIKLEIWKRKNKEHIDFFYSGSYVSSEELYHLMD